MKRFLVFIFLGPAVGLAVFVFIFLPISRTILTGPISGPFEGIGLTLILLPWGYLVGMVPACAEALLDWFLARKGVKYRPMWCFLFGMLLGSPVALSGRSLDIFLLRGIGGLVAAIPAALCSWPSSDAEAVT